MMLITFLIAFYILFTPLALCEEQVPVGVKAIGMGSAFVPVADDGTAISWNPAGVSRLKQYTINLMYSKLFDVGATNYISGIAPASEKLAIGMDWTHIGIEDDEINFSQDELNISYSYQPVDSLAVGANLKYIANNLSYDRSFVGTSSGWGTDFGILFSPRFFDEFTLGFVATDALWFRSGKFIRGTRVKYDTGASDTIFAPGYKVGIAYKPGRNWLFALGIDDRVHAGAEFSPHEILDIRAGIEKDLHISESPTYSLGGTIEYKGIDFDYAYVIAPTLPSTSLFSLSIAFEFQKPPVTIEKVRLKDIYPIHQYYYANKPNYAAPEKIVMDDYVPFIYSSADEDRFYPFEPEDTIGRIWLKNITNKPVLLKVKLYADKYIGKNGTDVINNLQLEPMQRKSAPLRRIVFTDEVLGITKLQTVEATIEVIDVTHESRRKAKASASLQIHSRNNTKLDDIAKLASFISPENKAVREFALGVLKLYKSELEETPLNQNLYKAMLLFDALYGMNYAIDSNIPYGSGQKDEIKFPEEMLRELTLFSQKVSQSTKEEQAVGFGDCDDSTALYCALLEASGIHTALIQQPGHVLMAFDVGGLTLERAQELEIPDKFYESIGGYVWIPIETTLIKEGFVKAWHDANEGIRKDIVDIISLQQAWEQYGSVNIGGGWAPKIPEKVRINEGVMRDLNSEWMQDAKKYFGNLSGEE